MVDYTGTFKAAVVQAEPVWLDADATIEKCESLIAEAAASGAKLIAFPETFIPGYPFWIWLDTPLEGMRFWKRYHENSLTVPGDRFQRLCRAARRHAIVVAAGYSERRGASLYMGQALISSTGELIAARRKLKPTHAERFVFGEGDGSDLTVYDTELGRIGALNCWEHIQPLNRHAMYSQHEQIHVAAWPSFSCGADQVYGFGPEFPACISQSYAAEGQCFVLAATAVVLDAGIELFCDTDAKRKVLMRGGGVTRIFGPDARPLSTPLAADAEGLVYAHIDLSDIVMAKAAADPVGHYARPDVLSLRFNQFPRSSVVAVVSDPDMVPDELTAASRGQDGA